MKKRILSLILAVLLLSATTVLFSCSKEEMPPEDVYTRVTVDINPSIELMVDHENKIVSATALNDDGSILIAGEVLVGKTPEEATELVVTLAGETGYLVKGNVAADENTVRISVSGDSKYADALRESVEQRAGDVLEKLDIDGRVERAEALSHEALLALALETGLYTEEELSEMTDEQLCKVVALGRVETALLLTEEMREAYYRAKEYEISFAEKEATADVIEAMGGIYTLVHTGYVTMLNAYSETIRKIDEFRYNTLVSPESEYQKSLARLRESKTEYLKQKNYTASLEVNGELYASATVTLQMTEEEYEKALAAYEKLGNDANAALESLVAAMREAEEALIAFEENFSDDIKAELQAKATEIESAVNARKDNFFAEFEAAHKADIEAAEADLVARKQALIAAVENPEQ